MAERIIRQLTTSNYDFPTLAQSKKGKYVDKTDLLYELACNEDDSQYFISRPRRFGKSLMLSTLKAMFEGRRDLFKGLKLDDLPWECWDEKRRYPVYSFTMSGAIDNAFETGVLQNYWEATGHATMILDRIKAADEIPTDLNGLTATRTQLDVCQAETMPLEALLYQGGYLTIKKVRPSGKLVLGIPNEEISTSLAEGYVSSLLTNSLSDWNEDLADAQDDLIEKGVETLLRKNLKAVFAAVPHEWKIEGEREAKRYFLLFMKLIGADVSGERQSARGRADAILKDKSGVYVFEFKYGKTPQEAVEQARTKDYAGPWLAEPTRPEGSPHHPPVFLVGVNYDPERRGIDDPLVVKA